MTTEIWRVHILWIFQITKITRAKSPIQNGLSGGFQERVGIISVVKGQTHFLKKVCPFLSYFGSLQSLK